MDVSNDDDDDDTLFNTGDSLGKALALIEQVRAIFFRLFFC
jgi:hypothetical protein